MHMTMDAKNSNQVNFIGRAQLTPVVPLPDGLGQSGLLVAVSNMPKTKILPSLEEIEIPRSEASLESFDFLVASTNSKMDELLSASRRLAKQHPGLKVVLVDSQEAPLLEDELPEGVESVVQVTEEQAEAGRGLLYQQASILAGQNGGRAAYVAFIMEAKIEAGARIAIATTNLTPSLLGVD